MAINRRQILLGGVSAVLVTLTGCPRAQRTGIAFLNSPASDAAIAVTASSPGRSYSSGNLAPGSQKKRTFLVRGNPGETKPITAEVTIFTPGGPVTLNLLPPMAVATLGKTTTWTSPRSVAWLPTSAG